MDVLAGEVVGVFAHVECADEHRAGRFEPRDERRIALRRRQLAVDLRAGAGRQAGDVEQVLHRERHAGKRPERSAPGVFRIEHRRALARPRRGDVGEGIEQRIVLLDARQRRLDDRDRRRLAPIDRARNLERRAFRIDHRPISAPTLAPKAVIARLDRAIQ